MSERILIASINTERKSRMATNVYYTSYPDNPPEWYWLNGLHDACIINTEMLEFQFDYNKFIEQKSNYNRNLLKLEINSKDAMFDSTVKEVHFYNYKILTTDISLENRKSLWWLSDRLTANNDHYVLEIDLHDFNSRPEDFTLKIKFERAEVVRN